MFEKRVPSFEFQVSGSRFQVQEFKFFMLNSLLIGSPFVRGDVEDRGVKKLIVQSSEFRVQSSKFQVNTNTNYSILFAFSLLNTATVEQSEIPIFRGDC